MANEDPNKYGESITSDIPGIDFILQLLGMGPKAPAAVSAPASGKALPRPVAAPAYQDSQGRKYPYPVDGAGNPYAVKR